VRYFEVAVSTPLLGCAVGLFGCRAISFAHCGASGIRRRSDTRANRVGRCRRTRAARSAHRELRVFRKPDPHPDCTAGSRRDAIRLRSAGASGNTTGNILQISRTVAAATILRLCNFCHARPLYYCRADGRGTMAERDLTAREDRVVGLGLAAAAIILVFMFIVTYS
jgi:hypothetical protein